MMKQFRAYGVASKLYDTPDAAAGDTYTDKDGSLVVAPFAFPANPYSQEVLNASNIFEIGTGVGRNIRWIMENTKANYFGVEPNPNMYKYIWNFVDSKYKDRCYISQTFDSIINSVKYDVVISTFVFQHIGYMPDEHEPNTENVSDITNHIRKNTKLGTIWILYEHDSEDLWIDRWFNEQHIKPDVYIRGFKEVPQLTLRDSCAPNGGHHLIIWKETS
jgi:cyclopropane fatty-acyl-phospholipid synthase-like methyltransferase